MTILLTLAAMFALLLARVPVAFALGGLGLAMLLLGGFSPLMAPQAILSTLDGFILLAVPLFLLMSNILLRAGVGNDLFAAVSAWVGHWPGGLAVATILSCGVFAAISGSSVATAATIGTVAIPEMINRGYNKKFVYGLLAAGGTLGILIPPSIPMIIYGFVTEESVISLFLAGIGPGIALLVFFILFSMVYARMGGQEREPKQGWAERRRATLKALPAVILAVLIISGIYSGAFTPTEAAAIGFAASLIITGPIMRVLTWDALKKAVFDSMATTVAIILIIAGAKIFGKAITLYRIPQDISMMITQGIDTDLGFILVVTAVLLVMGLVFEALSMVLIMTPVLLPAALALGFDPIWFGVYMVIMVECALITPPVGLNLYVIQSVAKARLGEVASGVAPFLILMFVTAAILYVWHDLALYIPFKL
ncbi:MULTISPECIES: TRAP transporter large permease [Thalassospira]|jgi:C4-dicarboxylate transporter DctM subunit|uniref:TRAP transporter large permease protein n=1 Tax=Thalassospira povalilytica TaxID=732237 RepID=A0A8I1SHR4_9PROT|nr:MULTISPECIES: TRAP transporter large permease [Thalassospira]MEE3046193.1 TRAP transporter large permease [Pseudomonadota bacterium]KZB69852.1 C4-dicarboxylate ABC transporter permease [Thalassospira sp. MCCC 1A02491]MBN8196597.1 TRAP transporter large permease [Thalassospira povalilytica]MBO6772969.1 TRAP transporter large permease [Thalassospira sp.]MCC4241251.1 TRAP transporter large permease [Thalassospira povalilytica]